MIPTTLVEPEKSGFEMVLGFLDTLLKDRFFEGIRSKHRTLYEIEQTLELIQMYQHRVNVEGKALVRFSESFIRHYATDNNQCFNTAEALFKKIQSTIKNLKEVFKKTTPRDYRQLPPGKDAPSVFEMSPLGGGDYTLDAFGLESFPQPVQDLYHAIDTLFTTSATQLALCHLMMEEEEKTRNDIERLRQIYNESCNELLDTVRAAAAFFSTAQEMPANEMEELRKKKGVKNIDEFLKEGYHRYDNKVFTQYLIIKNIREARAEGLTETETLFWRKNHQKAIQVRHVIAHFDKIVDVEGQKGSLRSSVLVEFLKWCGLASESFEKQMYEKYFVPSYSAKGKYKPLGWNTISGKRKELKETWEYTDEKLVMEFEDRLSRSFQKDAETASVVLPSLQEAS